MQFVLPQLMSFISARLRETLMALLGTCVMCRSVRAAANTEIKTGILS